MKYLLALFAALLVGHQYATMAKLAVLPPLVTYLSLSNFIETVGAVVQFTTYDVILLAALSCCAVVILSAEVRSGALSRLLESACRTDTAAIAFLLAAASVSVRFYFSPGDFSWDADSAVHIMLNDLATLTIANGEGPWWTNYVGAGSPFLQFYGFTFFLLSGLLSIATDGIVGLKITLGLCHILSSLGPYCVIRRAGGSRPSAIVAGLAYTLCFWHTQHVLVMGRFPVAMVYVTIPWAFFGHHTLDHDGSKRLRDSAVSGAALGLTLLTHPGYGYWTVGLLLVYLLIRVVIDRHQVTRAAIAGMTGALLLGLGIGAALLLPMWLDRPWTGLADGFSMRDQPDPHLWQLFNWSNFTFLAFPVEMAAFNWYGGYMGLSLWLTTLFGSWVAVLSRRLRQPLLPFLLMLLVSLAIVFFYRTLVVQHIPGIELLASGRYLLFASFFLSLCTGSAVCVLESRWRTVRPASTMVLVVMCIDLLPTTFQQPYRQHSDYFDPSGLPVATYEPIANATARFQRIDELPNFRSVRTYRGIYPYEAQATLLRFAGAPGIDGPLNGELAAVSEFSRPLSSFLSLKFHLGDETGENVRISYPVFAALALLNARFSMFSDYDGNDKSVSTIELPSASPIILSGTASGAPTLGESRKMLEAFYTAGELSQIHSLTDHAAVHRALGIVVGMGMDPTTLAAERIFLQNPTQGSSLGTRPELVSLVHRVQNQRVELTVDVSEDCYARLAYGFYPHLAVHVDGHAVEPLQTAGRFIALRLGAGKHHVVLQHRLSTLRLVLLMVSGTLLAISAAIILSYGKLNWGHLTPKRTLQQ